MCGQRERPFNPKVRSDRHEEQALALLRYPVIGGVQHLMYDVVAEAVLTPPRVVPLQS
jgi:hypothetical protein